MRICNTDTVLIVSEWVRHLLTQTCRVLYALHVTSWRMTVTTLQGPSARVLTTSCSVVSDRMCPNTTSNGPGRTDVSSFEFKQQSGTVLR